MPDPLVFVIVAVFNGESWIRECLDSILRQTYRNVEIVVVNDGSEDRTAEILSGYHDRKLKIIHTPNRGLSAARNVGLRSATGEFVSFVDADDMLPPWSIAKRVWAILESGADAAVTPTALNIQDTFPFVPLQALSSAYDPSVAEIVSGKELLIRQSKGTFWAVPQCYLIGRRACDIPEFDETFMFMEDNEWLSRFLPTLDRVVILAGWDYVYRVRPGSMSRTRSTARTARWGRQYQTVLKQTRAVVPVERAVELRGIVQARYHFWPYASDELRNAFGEAYRSLGREGVLACIGIAWAERVGRVVGWRGAILALRLHAWIKRQTLRLAAWLARL